MIDNKENIPGIDSVSWDKNFIETIYLPDFPTIKLRHQINASHLCDNLEWREDADGYQCSSHANITFTTTANLLVFEAVDYAHYGAMVTPSVLNYHNLLLQLPPLPDGEKARLIPISLPAGENIITIINSLQTNCSWDGIPKSYIIRAILSDAPLNLIKPVKSTKKRMVIYGDSIAAGGNADIPGINAWGTILRQNYDISFEASGWKRLQDDSDKLPEVAKRIASCQPDIVWLGIGVNDFQCPDPVDAGIFAKTYDIFLNLLYKYLPNAVIIAQSPIVMANANLPNAVGNTLNDYRNAIKKTAMDYSRCNYADGTSILKLSDLADGVHPHTAGMAKYAQWAKNYLDKLFESDK